MEKGNQCHAHMREILAKVSITSSTETAAFDAALGLLERSLFDYSAGPDQAYSSNVACRRMRSFPTKPSGLPVQPGGRAFTGHADEFAVEVRFGVEAA
ncbi:hypothetical protein EDC90_1004106 [Martelella mediterranea]|uniref:Uncharacterized protein n=1 Tax=Martelella mediterranea TaxID=293089 RepID=A0A4R3P3U9_9HYPH|nr:hypothetical protein EDC90_1004106 [Martelella mediterranea]